MSDISFDARLSTAGLHLPHQELAKLQALVEDIDAAVKNLRFARPYAEEPLSAFRLRPA